MISENQQQTASPVLTRFQQYMAKKKAAKEAKAAEKAKQIEAGVITVRQDKINATLQRLRDRLEKLTNGSKDKMYQKRYGNEMINYAFRIVENVKEMRYAGDYKFTIERSKGRTENWKFHMIDDIKELQNQIASNEFKLKEAIEADNKEMEKIAKKQAAEKKFRSVLDNLPANLKKFMEDAIKYQNDFVAKKKAEITELVKGWKKEREAIEDSRKKAEHYRDHEMQLTPLEARLYSTDLETLYKLNRSAIELDVYDLMWRVLDKCGEIVDTDDLHYHKGHINGWVEGTKDKAYVDSIFAGGYNIQRLHIRTLVK